MGFFGKLFRRRPNAAKVKALQKRFKDEIHIDVGVHSDSVAYPDGTPTGLVAGANEFGTSTIPERSFLRSTMEEKQEAYSKLGAELMQLVAADKMTMEEAATITGLQMVADVQDKITELKDPPNAPSTIKRKGSDNPLIDTGHLRNQINYKIRKGAK